MIKLSSIICTYERYPVLALAIESLLAQKIPIGTFEIIVIDNGPNPLIAQQFAQQYAGIDHLRYEHTPVPGLSNARNQGIALAQAGIIGYIDDDAVADPHWAEAMIRAFDEAGPSTGAVGGVVTPIWRSERPDWLSDGLLSYLAISNFGPAAKTMPTEQNIVGCNMALNKALLLECGGFAIHLGRSGPGTTLISNEECELFIRMRAKGYQIHYTPDAVVGHHIDPARLTKTWFRRRAAWQAVSDWLMIPQDMAGHAQGAANYLSEIEKAGSRALSMAFFNPAANGSELEEDLFIIRQLVVATLNGGAEMIPAAGPPPKSW